MAQSAFELVVHVLYQILKPKCENTHAQDLMVSILYLEKVWLLQTLTDINFKRGIIHDL